MDVAASEFYNDKDKTYDLNFKEEVVSMFISCEDFFKIFSGVLLTLPLLAVEQ